MFSESPKKKEELVKSLPAVKKLKGLIKHKMSLNDLSESLKPYEEVGCVVFENQIDILFRKTWAVLETDSFQKVGEILSHKRVKWWGYDLKSIWKILKPKNPIPAWDLMLAEHLAESRSSTSFSFLVQKELGEEMSVENAVLCLIQLREIYSKKIEDFKYVYENIELPLVPVLYKMEERGVFLDKNFLIQEQKKLTKDLSEIENKIFSLAGHPFNVSSPKQLSYVLFDELGLTKGRKTKIGYSTDNDILWKLKKEHPIASLLLEYREFFKLKTTYADGLLSSVEDSGRVHTCFKQTLTSTGRLSSTHPNLQNIPIRTERGRRIRKAFIADKNHQLISADYSQIELRILAHFSKDKGLQTAFSQGEDIHKSTAAELFNSPLGSITPEERRAAKAVNFGITYGQSAFGLSSTLGVSRERGRELVDRYFTKFPKVKEYIEEALNQARKKGFSETLFGRRRKVSELFSSNQRLKKFGERAIFNSAIQGTASDLVKIAMIQLSESLWSPLLLQVHDELLFECSDDNREYEQKCIQSIMEDGKNLSLDVPLKVNIGCGKNWDSAMH